jgi:hypothetical protein
VMSSEQFSRTFARSSLSAGSIFRSATDWFTPDFSQLPEI